MLFRSVKNNIVNHGYCKQNELVELYQKCEMCFFPSLLETFSATLLEAMFFNLLIVASDYSFNKEVTDEAALYFDSLNPHDAACKISRLANDDCLQKEMLKKNKLVLNKYKNYDEHYRQTINFIQEIINRNE